MLPGGHRFDKKFICIRYPGNVVNPDRAIETLGGIGAISTVLYIFNKCTYINNTVIVTIVNINRQ